MFHTTKLSATHTDCTLSGLNSHTLVLLLVSSTSLNCDHHTGCYMLPTHNQRANSNQGCPATGIAGVSTGAGGICACTTICSGPTPVAWSCDTNSSACRCMRANKK